MPLKKTLSTSPTHASEQSHSAPAVLVPPALRHVALINGPSAAAVGSMSISWWLEQVRSGRAPRPVIQTSRCSRWKISDVEAFWAKRAAGSALDDGVVGRASQASSRAKAKRQQAAVVE